MSLQALADEAQQLSAEGRFGEAVDKYDELLAKNDGIAEVHLNRGVALNNAEQPEEALAAFRRAIKLKPSLVTAHNNAGTVLAKMGRHAEAAKAFREAVSLEPKLTSAWRNLAHELNAAGDHEAAASAAQDGVRALHGTHPALHNERIFALFKLGRSVEALDDVEAILAETPMPTLSPEQRELYSMVLAQQGRTLMSSGRSADAQDFLERACEGDDGPDNLFALALCMLQQDKDDDALPLLEKAARGDPDNWRLHVTMGTVHMRARRFAEAAVALEQALQHKAAQEAVTVQFNYAVALMNLDRDEEARAPLEFVVKHDPDNHVALALLGTVLLQAKDFKGAVKVLEKAAATPEGAKDASLLYNLGYARLMCDKPEAAVDAFEKSVAINPDNQHARAALEALADVKKEDAGRWSLREVIRVAREKNRKNPPPELAKRKSKSKLSPLERAQALALGPERPEFLRRKSMEGIRSGYVQALAEVYDEMTQENLHG